MIRMPVFKPHFRVKVVPDEGVFLLSDVGRKVLTGRLFQLIAPLVDGKRTSDDIADCVAGMVPPAEVYYALSLLEDKGYLIEADAADPLAAFWTVRGVDPRKASERLGDLPVSVIGLGEVNTGAFVSILETFGIRTAEDGGLRLVVTDDYLRAGLDEWNEQALLDRRPWMLLKPVGIEIFIGPLLVPDKTGCWRCLRDRHILSRDVDRLIMEKTGMKEPVPPSKVHAPATLHTAYNMAATEIATWIASGDNPRIEGALFSVDTRTWQTTPHTLSRLVHCPSCGNARDTRNRISPVKLRESKALFTRDGGYRIAIPTETLQKFNHLLSPVTGIVSFLEREETIDGTAHIYWAGHSHSAAIDKSAVLKKWMIHRAMGKGVSEAQARASALCEAIERYSGVFQGYEPRITSSLVQLGDQAIHPNSCMLFSPNQYRKRAELNAKKSMFNFVPEPFEDESIEIEWSPVWSLTNETFKYLPTQFLYYGYWYPDGKRKPIYCPVDSNGNASGNNLEEAVLQGFLELVERDGAAQWWYNRLKRPAVDLASFGEPYLEEIVSYYRKLNRELWVLDITSDLGIPTFVAVSAKIGRIRERVILGCGCHLDAKLGVLRAVTEMNQMLSTGERTYDEGNPLQPDVEDQDALDWITSATCENQPYMTPDEHLPLKRFDDYPKPYSDDLLENILHCRKIVEGRGMEVLVLDQTRTDIGVSVAKVIVPGLRHYWARFGPGRLYDVPVRMGWIEKPLGEAELNPIRLFH